MLPARRELLDIILKAAGDAVCDSETHRLKPNQLPLLNEQWTQSYVGIALNDHLREKYGDPTTSYVTFETSVAWLEEFCGVEGRIGRPPGSLTARQRFDVVAWAKGGSPVGLIEIKDQPIISSYAQTADPKKLCGALSRWPSLRWGVFLASMRTTRPEERSAVDRELRRKSALVAGAVKKAVNSGYAGHRVHIVDKRGSRTGWLAVLLKRPSD